MKILFPFNNYVYIFAISKCFSKSKMTENKPSDINHSELFSIIKDRGGDLVSTLNVFREPIFTLSETDITKSVFNQWKKENIIDKLLVGNNTSRSWNRFSITELTILYVVNTLWERNINDEKIKEVIDFLIDGDDLEKQVNDILEDEENRYLNMLEKAQNIDLIGYIATQKKQNPNLPVITNIEALLISCMKLNRPYTMVVTENGKIEIFVTSLLTDLFLSKDYYNKLYKELFSKPFLNISLDFIVSKILKKINTNNADVFVSTSNNQIQKLINKGYSIEVLNDIFGKPRIENYTEELLDLKTNIQFAAREFNDQHLLIKVVGKRISSIRRIIFKK